MTSRQVSTGERGLFNGTLISLLLSLPAYVIILSRVYVRMFFSQLLDVRHDLQMLLIGVFKDVERISRQNTVVLQKSMLITFKVQIIFSTIDAISRICDLSCRFLKLVINIIPFILLSFTKLLEHHSTLFFKPTPLSSQPFQRAVLVI